MTPDQFYANVGTVFGWQQDYPTDGQYGYHHGVDLPWGGGTAIPPWTPGTVIVNSYNSALGNFVVIDRGTVVPASQRYAGFCHMVKRPGWAPPARIEFGGTVGNVGRTGEAYGEIIAGTVSSNSSLGIELTFAAEQ